MKTIELKNVKITIGDEDAADDRVVIVKGQSMGKTERMLTAAGSSFEPPLDNTMITYVDRQPAPTGPNRKARRRALAKLPRRI